MKYVDRPSEVKKFRDEWRKKGYELVNITPLCQVRIGDSGWCNDFNEPEESCHHIQILYRDECIANAAGDGIHLIDDARCAVLDLPDCCGNDFVIFLKVKRYEKKPKRKPRNGKKRTVSK